MNKFTESTKQALAYYVYRLVDPRNGETFYVGKGKDDRVFQHLQGAIKSIEEEPETLKLKRISVIRTLGLEPIHVIHRHGLTEESAFEVEAALMDAYPGLSNIQAGHGSAARGSAHSSQIESQYNAPLFDTKLPCILIWINKSAEEADNLYEATRGNWRLNVENARKAKYALAIVRGMVREAFEISSWEKVDDRYRFSGAVASDDVRKDLVHHRLHEDFRKKGAANPIRYLNLE